MLVGCARSAESFASCMPIYEFYGVFNSHVSPEYFLTGHEVEKIIALQNNNRPREIKRLLAYPPATKLILILGPYSGSTATVLNVEKTASQNLLILDMIIQTSQIGLAVMGQPFWLARVDSQCRVSMAKN